MVEQVNSTSTTFRHPLRIAIVEKVLEADGGKLSPKEITEQLGDRVVGKGEPLGVVSYHVRQLAAAGVLRLVGKPRQVRGALQHFYRVDVERLVALAAELAIFAHRLEVLAIDALPQRDPVSA